MPRLPRFTPAGLPLHVTQRGNYQQNVFLTDDDRRFYLNLLDRLSATYRVRTLAYCLMTNHVHLVLAPETDHGVSFLMAIARLRILAGDQRAPSTDGALVETAGENAAAVDLLDLSPTDRVLEVGFGHGRTLTEIIKRVPSGFVAGADASPDMLRLAIGANRNAIDRGQLVLKHVESHALPFASQSFDKLLSVHTLYFWKHPLIELLECRRVLSNGGRLVLGFRPKSPIAEAEFPSSVYLFRDVAEVARLLSESGFSSVGASEFRSANRVIALLTAHADGAPPVSGR